MPFHHKFKAAKNKIKKDDSASKKRSLVFDLAIIFCSMCWSVMLSCNSETELTPAKKQEVIAKVQQALQNYYDDIKAKGLTAELEYLDSSADFFWVPPGYAGPILYDSVYNILKQNAPSFSSISTSINYLKVIPLTEDYATYTARLTSSMTDILKNTTNIRLVETGVMVKRPAGWKLLHGQTQVVQ